MAGEKVLIAELDIDTGNVVKEQQTLLMQINQLKKDIKDARGTTEEYSETNIKNQASLKTLNTQYRANQRVIEGLSATQTGQVKTIREARSVVSALTVEWQKSAQVNGENDERTQALAEKLSTLNKQINENKLAVGDSTSNIGKYNNQLKDSIASAGSLPGPLGAATVSIQGMAGASKAFIATGIGAIFIALAAVVGTLTKAFKRSEGRMNKLRVIGGKVSGVFNGLLKILEPVADFIANTVVKAFDTLGKIADKTIGLVSRGLAKLGFNKAAESVDQFQQNMREAAQAGEALAEAQNKLTQALRVQEKIQLDFQKLAERQRQIRDDESKAIDERITANQKLGEILQKQLQEELRIANLALDVANQRIKVEGETTGALDERAEALLKVSEIEERIVGQQSEQLVNINALNKERVELEQQRADELDKLINDELEAIDESIDLQLEKEKELADQSLEIFRQKLEKVKELADQQREQELIDEENRLINLENGLEREFQLRQFDLDRRREAELAQAESIGADTLSIKKKFDNAEVMLEKQKQIAKFQLASGFAGNLAAIFGEQTAVGKAAAIAQTTIDTYVSAQSAYKSLVGIPVVGPGLAVAAAGAAVATGLKNIAGIKKVSTNVSGGGGGGGISIASPSASSGISANIPSPTAGATAGQNFGAAIVTSGNQQQAAAAQATQAGLERALENAPPVLVKEDFEAVENRSVRVVEESEQ